jgi:hypothetical protein
VYGRLGNTSLLAMPAGAVALGGMEILWYVVAGCTLLAAGLALVRLLPRRKR